MTAMEQRIFELFGEPDMRAAKLTATVAREFGVSQDEAGEVAKRVLHEHGTPRSVAVKEALDRLEKIRF